MSFHIDFIARTKVHAKHLLERQSSLPGPVRSFIGSAIDALEVTDEERLIKVHAHGHLCSGSDHPHSSASIEVTPIVATA